MNPGTYGKGLELARGFVGASGGACPLGVGLGPAAAALEQLRALASARLIAAVAATPYDLRWPRRRLGPVAAREMTASSKQWCFRHSHLPKRALDIRDDGYRLRLQKDCRVLLEQMGRSSYISAGCAAYLDAMYYTFSVSLKELVRTPAQAPRQGRRRVRGEASSTQARTPMAPSALTRERPTRLFLSELEATGDVQLAASRAGCMPIEVARWRRSDPKFARDFALAIAAHLRMLRRLIEEVARAHENESVRQRAVELLNHEAAYRDPDGRLDAKAWARLLGTFLATLGLDAASWEPELV